MIAKLVHYIAQVFDAAGSASFSRWATAVTVLSGVFSMLYLVLHNHALPEPLQIGALAAWMVSPYSVNKASGFFGNRSQSPGVVPNLNASEDAGRAMPSDGKLIFAFIFGSILLYALTHTNCH